MVDLLPILMSATRTVQQLMQHWFAAYPAGMPWTVVSDYCVGDEGKKNDVFSFVVIANHDKTARHGAGIVSALPTTGTQYAR